jgi:Methyltransferase FkbM domain
MDFRQSLMRLLQLSHGDQDLAHASLSGEGKAGVGDFLGRFREIVSDPINLLIERDPRAGMVKNGLVWLHNGNRVAADGKGAYYGKFSHVLILNRGVHEPLEEYVFQEVLRRMPDAPMMLELGAYWGHYSMWMKRMRPLATVFLVEPDAAGLEVGRENFARHGYDGTFIHARVGKQDFHVDDFLRERNYPKLDILHSDIQGYELEMLEGCVESLRRSLINYIFVSTHSELLHEQVIAFLSANGMRIEVTSGCDLQTTSHDGLVFASNMASPAVFAQFSPIGRCEILRSDPMKLVAYLSSVPHSGNIQSAQNYE